MPSGECTVLGPASLWGHYALIYDDFFCRFAGRSSPTIVHWIGSINAIKCLFYYATIAIVHWIGSINAIKYLFYYATIAYHVGLNAVLGLPHPGPTS